MHRVAERPTETLADGTRMQQLTSNGKPAGQASLLAAMWRFRWPVVAVLVAFVALGYLANENKNVEFVATADLIVEDPRASSVEVTDVAVQSTQSSERYLADQVEILRSAEAAAIAAELSGGAVSSKQLLDDRSISGDATSNLIEISVRADTPEAAKAGADALLAAYSELRQRQVQATAQAALAELDALRQAIDEELDAIDIRIAELAAVDEDRVELREQVEEAVRELNTLRDTRATLAVGSEARLAVNARIAELLTDFETWRVVQDITFEDGATTALVAERDAAIAERAALVARRNAIAVDAELAAAGVTLASPAALPESPAGVPDALVWIGAVLVGLATAAVIAYFLSLRDGSLTSRELPDRLLGAPLLAEIPDFGHEHLRGKMPVKEAPSSAAAEAFRFAAASIDLRATAREARLLSVVSATVGSGKTVTVANAGLAAAREGKRILLVDGDFGSQELTNLLVDEAPKWGITDIVSGEIHLLQALVDVTLEDGRSISLLSRGNQEVQAAGFYQSVLTKDFFAHLPVLYDLVLVDCPPLLQVAYASTLASYTDASVVAVEHHSSTNQLRALADRLDVVGTPVLGYVYTKAPLRREMAAGVGSMVNVLGTPETPAGTNGWRARLRVGNRPR